MAKGKANVKGAEKQKSNPPKEKFVLKAHLFHRDVISVLERKYRLAMRMKNYTTASRVYKELEGAKKEHRNLIHRKDHVKIK